MSDTEAYIQVRLFDGRRQVITDDGLNVLMTITDGWQNQRCRRDFSASYLARTPFSVQTFNNSGDLYAVVAYADGFKQVGFHPVRVAQGALQNVDLMLIRSNAKFDFSPAKWNLLASSQPAAFRLLSADCSPETAQKRYEKLVDDERSQPKLACFWNLVTAMSQIQLPQGTPLDYLRQVIWDDPALEFAQDRFFAWATPDLVEQVKEAARQGEFAPELDPSFFHGDATCSFKQVQFGEANVQLTFHERRTATVGGENCIVVEPDIDYYKDLAAHALFEVLANKVTHSLTNPEEVYVLRWVAGRHAGVPDFNPPYWFV